MYIMSKKGDFEIPKVINPDFSTKTVPDQYGFLNSTVPWVHKNRTIWGVPVQLVVVVVHIQSYYGGKIVF